MDDDVADEGSDSGLGLKHPDDELAEGFGKWVFGDRRPLDLGIHDRQL